MSDEASPTPSDLNAIEAEWPVIEAELVVVEAECRLAVSSSDELAVRAHRRAVTALAAVVRQTAAAERAAELVASRRNVRLLAGNRSRSPFLAVVPTTPTAA